MQLTDVKRKNVLFKIFLKRKKNKRLLQKNNRIIIWDHIMYRIASPFRAGDDRPLYYAEVLNSNGAMSRGDPIIQYSRQAGNAPEQVIL